MNKLCSKILLTLLLIIFLISSSVVLASDTSNESNTNEILESYETDYEFVESDMYLFDVNIDISQIIDGNVFAYGGTVNVTGEINGNLFVFANDLHIEESAIIHGSVFAVATNATISGIMADFYGVSETYKSEDNSIIARNLYLMANDVSLSGKIGKDANISTEQLKFNDDATNVIGGNLNYSSVNEFQIDDNIVAGEINYTQINENPSANIFSIVYSVISTLLFAFVVIMLTIWITPKFKDRVGEIIAKRSLLSLGIGILIFIGIIVVSLMLIFFSYGFATNIAIAAIALLVLAFSIANTVFSMSIAKVISNKFGWKSVAFVLLTLLIVLVIDLIGYIPYVGGPIGFITAIFGLGILCINAYKIKDLVGTENKE